MVFLQKLLDGARVEWRPFLEIIKSLKTGLNPRKNFQLNTSDAQGYYVTVREIQNGKILFCDQTDRVNETALELINNRSNLEAGDILFSGTGTVGRKAVIQETPKNWNIKEGVYVIKPHLDIVVSGYLFYLLDSTHIIREYSKKIVGSPVVSLPMNELKKLKIPIPCPENPQKSLKIQGEIVRILDSFTDLVTELNKELVLRQKQYAYYRDKLLDLPQDKVEWKRLGEVGEFIRGNGLQKKDFTEIGVPAIHYGQIYTRYGISADKTFTYVSEGLAKKLRKAHKNDLLLATTSENDEDVVKPLAWLGDEVAISGDMMLFRHQLNVKYLAYFFQTKAFQTQKNKYINGVKVRRVSSDDLAKIKIPIPPLAEQERIVTILDKFDTLTNSLTQGIPKEIELRQKQYEYYRDLLFDFGRR